jgi:hypothetical protein
VSLEHNLCQPADHSMSVSLMSEANTYSAGCQCGRVRYDVRLDLAQPVMSRNCSIAGARGRW